MADITTPGALQRARARRRALVKEGGKRLLRALGTYLGRQSLVPDAPVLSPSLFPWAKELAVRWESVRGELQALLRDRDALPRFQDISPDQARISPDDLWRTVVLYGFGQRFALTSDLCPETVRLLEAVPGLENAFFSILAPGKHVPAHRGVSKGLVRCHLGLVVPDERERCTMRVGDERVVWAPGELVFFDDTFEHEVTNASDQERAVLLFDFERPMRWPGRLVGRALLAGLRRTAYFKDAIRNQQAWEADYAALLEARAGGEEIEAQHEVNAPASAPGHARDSGRADLVEGLDTVK